MIPFSITSLVSKAGNLLPEMTCLLYVFGVVGYLTVIDGISSTFSSASLSCCWFCLRIRARTSGASKPF